MGATEQAAEVLRKAESSLRDLVSAAAGNGDYPGVLRVAAWAKALSDLLKEAPSGSRNTPEVIPEMHPTSRRPRLASGTVEPSRVGKTAYPRFIRQGDHLVRIAWSKKERAEYLHKTPHAVLRAVTDALADSGRDGRLFSTKQFLPVHEPDGTEVPSYQVYVVIALLKQLTLIDQHGRQGYSIPKLAEFRDAVEAAWRALPHN